MMADIFTSALEALAKSIAHLPNPTATFSVETTTLRLLGVSKIEKSIDLPQQVDIDLEQLQKLLRGGEKVFSTTNETPLVPELFSFASKLGFEKVALLEVSNGEKFYGLAMIGPINNQEITHEELAPYFDIISLANLVCDQNKTTNSIQNSVKEIESIKAIFDAIKTPWDTTQFFEALYEEIKKNIGDFSFIGALYDEKTSNLNIPYSYENGTTRTIESLQLGEGLTSVLLRNKQPLLLVENSEEQAKALGAKVDGKLARSWLGVPLTIQNQSVGAFILQDAENENAFNEEHLEYLKFLANQAAKIIYNARTLDESQNQIYKIQTSAEITRDISAALNLDELLRKAVDLTCERFNFYHVAVFLVDANKKHVVIREATGEAGSHMKRSGYKLDIGSDSIVGFVSKQGEPLIINDISQDATYLPNPLLPDTRTEAALPLKVGDQILGVLDVQNTIPFSFSHNDIETLNNLADQLAIAVRNTELFAETQEHLSQHRLLHHITTSAASGTTLEEALSAAVEGLQVTLGGDRVSILLSDNERKFLVMKAWVGYSDEVSDFIIPFGDGITGWVAARRKPLRINDVTQDVRYIEVSANTRSEMALPLIFRNEVLGVLNIESEQVSAYTENDEEMLGTLAGSLAAIIANARLVEQIRQQAERERQLYEISEKIRRSTDIQTILSTTINELSRVTGARRTEISVGISETAEAEPESQDNAEPTHEKEEESHE